MVRFHLTPGHLAPFILSIVLAVLELVSSVALGGQKAAIQKSKPESDGSLTGVVLPLATIEALGARLVEDYEAMTVIDLGQATAAALTEATGLAVWPLPDHDRILLHRYTLDAGSGLPTDIMIPDFPTNQPNLYLVVFRSIPKPEWVDALRSSGTRIITYIHENSYLVFAPLADLSQFRVRHPQVVNVLPFVPEFKLIQPARLAGDTGMAKILAQVANVPGAGTVVASIEALALPGTFGQLGAGEVILTWGEIPNESVTSLAHQPEVASIEPAPQIEPSGEREALIVAGALYPEMEGNRSVYKPDCTVDYYAWLQVRGLANASDIYLGLLDTGLDLGSTTDVHRDFKNSLGTSRVIYNTSYDPQTVSSADCTGHGTLIGAVMAADPRPTVGSGFAESTGCVGGSFYAGSGLAPAAQLLSRRVYNDSAGTTDNWPGMPNRVANGIANLAGYGAWVVNFSSNDPNASASYSSFSQLLDQRVRDASGIGIRNPVSIVVSAGNTNSSGAVQDPATAKNVISVGASESYNPNSWYDSCNAQGYADNAYDVAWFSTYGSRTDLPPSSPPDARDLRVKPDLVAPGTRAMGAASRDFNYWKPSCWWQTGTCADFLYGSRNTDGITWGSGTSFAAPAAAAAAGVVSKWYKTNNGVLPSPAMAKAMLINSAIDISGGRRDAAPVLHIGSAPFYQGWGKLDLARSFPSAGTYSKADQDYVFTASGSNPWSRNLTRVSPSTDVRVTLVWSDAPGFNGNGYALINDLDLHVIAGAATNFAGNRFNATTGRSIAYSSQPTDWDRRNNVEVVVFRPSDYGVTTFTVYIIPRTIAGVGVPGGPGSVNQDFAVFVDGAY